MDKRKLMLLATMTSKSSKDHEKHEEHEHHAAYGKGTEHGHEMAHSKRLFGYSCGSKMASSHTAARTWGFWMSAR